MIDFAALIAKMGEMMLYILIGFVCRKIGLFNDQTDRFCSRLMTDIAMPGLLFYTAVTSERVPGGTFALVLLLAVLWLFALTGLGYLIASPLAPKGPERGTYAFILAYGNLGVFGFSVIQPLLGSAGLARSLIINIPFALFTFSLGEILIRGKWDRNEKFWKLFLQPSPIISLLMPFLYLIRIPWPKLILSAAGTIGNMALPLLLFAGGSTLATVQRENLRGMSKTAVVSVLRLTLIPVLVWLVLRTFLQDEITLAVIVILTGTPTAGLALAINILHGNHTKEASFSILLSTLLSLVTVPLLVKLLFL